jgi:hypothetical protein
MRLAVPRTLGLVFLLLLAGYVFWGAPQLAGPGRRDVPGPEAQSVTPSLLPTEDAQQLQAISMPLGPLSPGPCQVFFGIMTTQGVHDFSGISTFAQKTAYWPRAYEFSQGWEADAFNATYLDAVARLGMLPIVSWEPWDYSAQPGADNLRGFQPRYRLSRIIDGSFDPYIRSWARGVKELGYTIAIRFAHEMNGYWYPWSEQANGNRKGEYVIAWRHVHDIFEAEGATNVVWMWSPNISYQNSTPLRELYPGDQYVDWIGLSGYYGTVGNEQYKSFDQLFTPSITEISRFTRRPIVIAETGAADNAGRKAEWITQLFESLPRHPEIIGVIWFEGVRQADWRVTASATASQAFAQGVADSRYQVTWQPWGVEPRSGVPVRACPLRSTRTAN